MARDLITFFLEQTAPPVGPPCEAPPGARLEEVPRPDLGFYRELYDAVGRPWGWRERRGLSDDALAAILHDPDVLFLLLRVEGEPAGFLELDARQPDEVEIKYLGLRERFVGRGFGRFLLDRAVRRAWQEAPRRVWLHTCTDDHPGALAFYRRHGFVPYRREAAGA